MPSPTSEQQAAIEHPGQLLVVAGAGAGKTRTLVERCVARLTDETNPVAPDRMLMVTFTKAAAAEMRHRIRARLEEALAAAGPGGRLEETIALLDSARISTIHSFCLDLVRENFHELDLDPRMTPLLPEQRRALVERTLDELISGHYERGGAVCDFIGGWAGGREEILREWAVKLHNYGQTLRSPEKWLAGQTACFQNPSPEAWEKWFAQELPEWAGEWAAQAWLRPGISEVEGARERLDALQWAGSRERSGGLLRELIEACEEKAFKKKGGDQVKTLRSGAEFLASVCPAGGSDPLVEDWEWCRRPMLALLEFTREFWMEFARVKREAGLIDFQDMEQFALRLLWDENQGAVTPLAESWRARLEMVLVDEYQDVNEAQDAILQAVSRERDAANRCLVGDVKQSIYRFRLADPRVFLGYQADWAAGDGGRVVNLSDNFRSHESLLHFVNSLFRDVMRAKIGGVHYSPEVELRFGAAESRAEHRTVEGGEPRVELIVRLDKGKSGGGTAEPVESEPDSEGGSEAVESAAGVEAEALLIGRRLRALRQEGWAASSHGQPVDWRDMVILLRAPGKKRETFAKVFHQLGIPLETSRAGFLDSSEVLDLQSLFLILDNPLQDLPLLAVLRSPFGGFSSPELVEIRLSRREGPFWTALQVYRATGGDEALRARVGRFAQAHEAWRHRVKQQPLSVCLESILDEAFYREWLEGEDRPAERLANVREFARLTREFDPFQREGLFRFIQFFEKQRELEAVIEPAFTRDGNAVRLMSIHQSKGLEFPVVVAADLGKAFNLDDLNRVILLDETMGLCPMTRPPGGGRAYPSLAHWLGRRRQRREALGEELRLLYVAVTRARDRLILAGAAAAKKVDGEWAERVRSLSTEGWIEAAGSPMDWIGCWLAGQLGAGTPSLPSNGKNALLFWEIVDDVQLPRSGAIPIPSVAEIVTGAPELDYDTLRDLERRLSWSYPHAAAQEEPAKTSVTALRRRLEEDDDARPARFLAGREEASARGEPGGLSAAETGVAHHLFMQWAEVEKLTSAEACAAEARRLTLAGRLSEAEAGALDLGALAGFWASELGRRITSHPERMRRELPFTARFDPRELLGLGLGEIESGLEGEFILVQGVVDLTVILQGEIWLVDFKTDRLSAGGLAEKVEKYRPQVRTYALALQMAYGLPVTEGYLHFLACGRSERVI